MTSTLNRLYPVLHSGLSSARDRTQWNAAADDIEALQARATIIEAELSGASTIGQVSLASASTVAIGAANGNYIKITAGTSPIGAFDTANAGVTRIIEFTVAVTITYNSTTMILPGAASITTAAGDIGVVVSEGSGNWRWVSYIRAAAPP